MRSEEQEAAFEALYRRNAARVYRIGLLFLGSAADAEDVTQTVFLHYLRAGPQFSGPAHEQGWFITTAKNVCRDCLRSGWRKRRVQTEQLPEGSYTQETEPSDVLEALLSLPLPYREVLYLYYYEDYSVKELASLLHRRESTLRTQLERGRKKLRKILETGGEYHDRPRPESGL